MWTKDIPNSEKFYRLGATVAILSIGVFLWQMPVQSRLLSPAGSTAFELITGDELGDQPGQWADVGRSEKAAWDDHFNTSAYIYGRDPAKFLAENVHILPVGEALDMPSSEGRNSVFLAKKGYRVEGLDISDVALHKARRLARENGVAATTQFNNADLTRYQIAESKYDVILNMGYLNRDLVALIRKGLKKGGMVVFQNRTVEQLNLVKGAAIRRDYLLEIGEARRLFSRRNGFEVVVYQEVVEGDDAFARVIARKL